MRAHHLINEKNLRVECPYCNNNLENQKWDSIFEFQHHYKQTFCSNCSRNIMIKTFFNGSGHDCWDRNSEFCKFIKGSSGEKNLEDKIKKII